MDCRICSADDLAAVLQGGSRQGRVFLAVNSAAVFYLVCMNVGRAVRVEVARGLEIAVDVEGGGFRACDLSCEVDAEAFFRADKLDAVRVHAADGGEIEGVRQRSQHDGQIPSINREILPCARKNIIFSRSISVRWW